MNESLRSFTSPDNEKPVNRTDPSSAKVFDFEKVKILAREITAKRQVGGDLEERITALDIDLEREGKPEATRPFLRKNRIVENEDRNNNRAVS